MIDLAPMRSYSFPPDEFQWISQAMVRSLENSINHSAKRDPARPQAVSTPYKKRAADLKKNQLNFTGAYPEALDAVLKKHPGISDLWRGRILALFCWHWNWFDHQWTALGKERPSFTPVGIRTSPHALAWRTVFNKGGVFQGISDAFGPLGVVFRCHAASLGNGEIDFAQQILRAGPFPRDPRFGDHKMSVTCPRQYPKWLRSEALPHIGWFRKGAPNPLPLLPRRTSTEHQPTTPPWSPTNDDMGYPWAAHVTVFEYLLYQYARTMVQIIKALRALPGAGREVEDERRNAIATIKELLRIDPRGQL